MSRASTSATERPRAGRVERDAGAGDAAADDEQVEALAAASARAPLPALRDRAPRLLTRRPGAARAPRGRRASAPARAPCPRRRAPARPGGRRRGPRRPGRARPRPPRPAPRCRARSPRGRARPRAGARRGRRRPAARTRSAASPPPTRSTSIPPEACCASRASAIWWATPASHAARQIGGRRRARRADHGDRSAPCQCGVPRPAGAGTTTGCGRAQSGARDGQSGGDEPARAQDAERVARRSRRTPRARRCGPRARSARRRWRARPRADRAARRPAFSHTNAPVPSVSAAIRGARAALAVERGGLVAQHGGDRRLEPRARDRRAPGPARPSRAPRAGAPRGTPKRSSRPASHPIVSTSSTRLRHALDGSLTCPAPPDRCQASQQATSPKASSPDSARARSAGSRSKSQRELRGREGGVERQAGDRADAGGGRVGGERAAQVARALILPAHHLRDRLSGRTLPEHERLGLVGDADAGHAAARRCAASLIAARAPASSSAGSCSTIPGPGREVATGRTAAATGSSRAS